MIVTHGAPVHDADIRGNVVCRNDLQVCLGVKVYHNRGGGCCVAIHEHSTPSDWTGASLLAQTLDRARTPRHIKARQAVILSAEYMEIFNRLPPDGSRLATAMDAWTRRERWPEEWARLAARSSATARQRVGSVLLKVATHPRREEIRRTQGRMLAYIEAMHPRMLSWSSWRGPCSRRAFAAVVEDWWEAVRAHLAALAELDRRRIARQPPAVPVFTWPT